MLCNQPIQIALCKANKNGRMICRTEIVFDAKSCKSSPDAPDHTGRLPRHLASAAAAI